MASRRELQQGSRVRVGHGSGVDSGKTGIVVSPTEVVLDGRGVPRNTRGAYRPVNWSKEVAVRLDDGELITMFMNRLTVLEDEVGFGDPGEEKVWVEAERTPQGNVILSLKDVRERRKLVQRYGRHNVYTDVDKIQNFPTQLMADLDKGRPIRFKMYQSAYESMLDGLPGLSGGDPQLSSMSRWEMQEYLEARGFAVYDDEPTDDLREAVRQQMELESEEEPEPWECQVCGGEVYPMGTLGRRVQGRCRRCGSDSSRGA